MTARALALVAALVGGCAEPLPVHVLDHDDELPLEVEAACEILGLLCEADDHNYGTITIELVDPAPAGALVVRGSTAGGGSCSPSMWVEPDAKLIAHELGHALGLEHRRGDADALMAAVRPGLELSDEEMSEIERGGDHLVGCRL